MPLFYLYTLYRSHRQHKEGQNCSGTLTKVSLYMCPRTGFKTRCLLQQKINHKLYTSGKFDGGQGDDVRRELTR